MRGVEWHTIDWTIDLDRRDIKWDRLAERQGTAFYFFSFVLPSFPSDLMCYVAGLGKITARRFFVANLLGRLVCAAFITSVGSGQFPITPATSALAAFVLCGLYGAWSLYKRSRRAK